MECKDLKNLIETKQPISFPLVMVYEDNKYLAIQYAKAIVGNEEVNYITNLNEISDDTGFYEDTSYYIYFTDKLEENVDSYDRLIVITKEIAELPKDVVLLPKLTDWQVLDFVKMRLPGVSEKDIEWLCKQAHYDIYRLSNECDKIAIFNESDQQLVFNQLKNENGFIDLTEFNVFDFTNAFVDHDLNKMAMLMKQAEVVDLEPTGIVTILKKQVKKYMDLQMNPKAKAVDLNMSDKQFWYLKNHPKFTNKQLIELYDELTLIDYKIKSGNLDLKSYETDGMINTKMLSYIVCKVLSICC